MNNKEMLQEIKKRVDGLVGFENASDDDLYYISKKHINWLIEQAEKIQRCQESYSGLDKMYDHWRNKAKELEKQLQQAQAKVEQYENALKKIADINLFEDIDRTTFLILTARKVLRGGKTQ